MKYLRLHLSGVLQYYAPPRTIVLGVSQVYFKTHPVPTRNAVVGMIGIVEGLSRRNPDTFDKLQYMKDILDIKYQVIRPGKIMVDFNTACPDENDCFPTIAGGHRHPGVGVYKKVEYLADAEFYVYIGGAASELKQIKEAFENPVWQPYLGKKKCIPSSPLLEDEDFVDLEDFTNVYDCP